jgi:hypothetical protein
MRIGVLAERAGTTTRALRLQCPVLDCPEPVQLAQF